MTLKIRNRFFKIFSFFSVCTVAAAALVLFTTTLGQKVMPPPTEIRTIPTFAIEFFSKCSFPMTICSIFILLFFVIIAGIFAIMHFQKTQSTELIFFFAFLGGILCEAFRILIISLGLWVTFSDSLLILGKLILFGRVMAALSFFFASLLSETSRRNEVERNFLMLIVISALIAAITPLNTARITSTGMATIGFSKMYTTFKITIIVLCALMFLYNAIREEKPSFNWLSASFLVLFMGYEIMTNSDCAITTVTGTLLLYLGTTQYLLTLHKIYLWA